VKCILHACGRDHLLYSCILIKFMYTTKIVCIPMQHGHIQNNNRIIDYGYIEQTRVLKLEPKLVPAEGASIACRCTP